MASPMIIPYQSQAGVQIANPGIAGQYRGAGAYSSGQENTGRGMQHLAAGIDKLNTAIFGVALTKQRDLQALDVANDLNSVRDDWNAYSTEYQANNRGALARNAEADAKSFWEEKGKNLSEKWGDNPRVMSHVGQQMGTMALSGVNSMREFSNKGLEDYRNDTIKKEVEHNIGIIQDFTRTTAERDNAKSQIVTAAVIQAQRGGLDVGLAARNAQEEMRRYEKVALKNRVDELELDGDFDGAEALLASAGMTPYTSMNSSLKAISSQAAKNITPEVDKAINNAAVSYGVSPDLIKAVGSAESNWNPSAVSKKGAQGFMQLMPATREEWEKKLGMKTGEGLSPDGNIKIGAAYLGWCLSQSGGNETLALMRYNWGTKNVNDWLSSGADPAAVPKETRGYVQKILGNAPGEGTVDVSDDLVEAGNIDLTKRPRIQNEDGSISTVNTMSSTIEGGRVVNYPGVNDERRLSQEEAWEQFKSTGKHFGIYKTQEAADTAAEKLHVDQERMYVGTEDRAIAQRPLLDPSEVSRYRKRIGKARQESEISTTYERINDSTKGLPMPERRAAFAESVSSVADLAVRSKLMSMHNKDMALEENRIASQDAYLVSQFEEQATSENLNYSQRIAGISELRKAGVSDAGIATYLKQLEKGRDTETSDNILAADALRKMIDEGKIKDASRIDTAAFEMGLTDGQKKEIKSYLEGGGPDGALFQLRKKLDDALKYYNNGKGLDKEPEFYDDFRKSMVPGDKLTDEYIRKRVVSLMVEGERKGSERLIKWGYGESMTFAEASRAGKGEEWLPDLTLKEEDEMRAKYRAAGVGEVSDTDLRWIKRQELGLPIPSGKIRKGL